jgi:hypothetical protein
MSYKKSVWDHTWNVSAGPLKGPFCNVTSAWQRCCLEDCSAPAEWPQWRSLTWCSSCRKSRMSQLALGSLLLLVVGRIMLAAIARMLSELAGTCRLPRTSCSSLQTCLPLPFVHAVVVESSKCLELWMPVSYNLPVSRAQPNEDQRC